MVPASLADQPMPQASNGPSKFRLWPGEPHQPVNSGLAFSSLMSVCCNKLHHRDCIQVLGSLGVHSCPSCQNVQTYKTEMIVNGIYFNESVPIRQKKEIECVDISVDDNVTSSDQDQHMSSPGKVPRDIDCSLKDSGISLDSPLEASTPIILEHDRSSKRKSINDPELCNESKRQKSISYNGDDSDIECTLLELRPRKLDGDDLRDGSLMEIEESRPGDDVVEGQRSKLLSIEYQSGEDIGLSSGSDTDCGDGAHSDNGENVPNFSDILSVSDDSLQNFSDILSVSDDSLLNDSSIEETDPFDIESLMGDTDLDEEDVAAFREEVTDAHSEQEIDNVERKDSGVGSSQEESPDSDKSNSNSSPTKSKSPVKEKQLAKQRKEVLKKIRHLPISERFILHGRNLLPWNQKDENYSEYTSEWMDNYDDCRIDEIIDLNNGEKSFFKLWNSHIRIYSGLGHCFMPTIVLRFIETSGVKILEKNLLRNFFAHLTSLEAVDIIGSDTVLRATYQLQKLMENIHVEDLNNSWRTIFRNSNRGNGRNCLETPRRRTKLVRKAKCEAKMNFLTGEEDTQQHCIEQQPHVADVADKTGNGLDTLHSMPILRDQSKTRRQTPPDINCDRAEIKFNSSPEMPVLKPETYMMGADDGGASNIQLEENPETKQKLNDKTFRRLRERKFEDKSSHLAASVRKKKSRKGKEKSEIEFSIKSHKKKKLRLSNKFTPIKRKLRKNFQFYNEQ